MGNEINIERLTQLDRELQIAINRELLDSAINEGFPTRLTLGQSLYRIMQCGSNLLMIYYRGADQKQISIQCMKLIGLCVSLWRQIQLGVFEDEG